MSCEICGEEILGKLAKVVVEGAILDVCPQCAHLGKPYVRPSVVEASRLQLQTIQTRNVNVRRPAPRKGSSSLPRTYEEFDVIENFGRKIRKARERQGMTQAELASKVNERLSIIQKIGLEKMIPNTNLCMSLEHTLRIALLTPRTEVPATPLNVGSAGEVTLGDVVRLKRKN